MCSAAAIGQPFWTPLYLFRDPRDIVISRCHHAEGKDSISINDLQECVMKEYGNTLYWIKLMEEVALRQGAAVSSPVVCYECLTAQNETLKSQCYRDLLSSVGMDVTSFELEKIISDTSFVNMKRNGEKKELYGANKFRAGTTKTRTEYGINVDILTWINAAYNILEKTWSSSCGYVRQEIKPFTNREYNNTIAANTTPKNILSSSGLEL